MAYLVGTRRAISIEQQRIVTTEMVRMVCNSSFVANVRCCLFYIPPYVSYRMVLAAPVAMCSPASI